MHEISRALRLNADIGKRNSVISSYVVNGGLVLKYDAYREFEPSVTFYSLLEQMR